MNFADKLNLHLSSLILPGTSFSLSQMKKLIESVPEKQQTREQNTLLYALAVAHNIFVQPEKTQFEALEFIMKVLIGKIRFSEPLSYLVTSNFLDFHQSCIYSSNDQIKKLNQHSFGLYPLSYPGLGLPVSMFMQKGKGQTFGNPHWQSARATLREYYQIKGSKTIERVREVYLVLLSDKRILDLWKKYPLKSFWAEMYFRYNTLTLQPYLQDEDREVTWQKQTVKQTILSTKQLQHNLSLDQRLIYYLCLAILSNYQEYKSALLYNPFQQAFSTFLRTEKDYSPWYYLMVLLIFRLIAKHCALIHIEEQCISRFKIFVRQQKNEKHATPFIYFFLNQEEILEYAVQNQIQYWVTPMPGQQKKKVAIFQLLNGIIFTQTLSCINKQQLIPRLFNSPLLSNRVIGMPQMQRLQKDQQVFVKHLGQLVDVPQQQLVRDYRLFIRVWKNYYQLLQANNLQLAESALTDNSNLHANSRFAFLLPRYDNHAAFNIVLRVAQAYRAKAAYFDTVPTLRQKMQFFQNQTFPQISSILTEQQCDQFWKEWIQILKHDKSFVGEIMRTDQ